jgi:two-component system chemotaxis response regulator CheY
MQSGSTTVLLVEDDETVRDAVSLMLERAGYLVTAAENGLVAAGLLEDWQPNLVITDIFMPDGDGIETLNLVKRRWPSTPVIAISGGSPMLRIDYLQVADDFGAAATVAKPFVGEQFLATIAQVLAGGSPKANH